MLLIILLFVLVSAPAFAAFETDGVGPSIGLSQQLLCNSMDLFQSDIGLLIGLAMAATGLWAVLWKGALKSGFTMILLGALITAVPSLIMSTLESAGNFLIETDISQAGANSALVDMRGKLGNCDEIVVDYSSYDTTTPEGYLTASRLGMAGLMDPKSEAARSFRQSAGRDRPMSQEQIAAMPASNVSAPGCSDLVQGGSRPSSGFGGRKHPIKGTWRMHKGADYAAPAGRAIYAAQSGRVTRVAFDAGGYGNWVEIDHGGGTSTRYAHMTQSGVRAGQQVTAGQVVGTVGSTGGSTGPHLHFEVRKNGDAVDPSTMCG